MIAKKQQVWENRGARFGRVSQGPKTDWRLLAMFVERFSNVPLVPPATLQTTLRRSTIKTKSELVKSAARCGSLSPELRLEWAPLVTFVERHSTVSVGQPVTWQTTSERSMICYFRNLMLLYSKPKLKFASLNVHQLSRKCLRIGGI